MGSSSTSLTTTQILIVVAVVCCVSGTVIATALLLKRRLSASGRSTSRVSGASAGSELVQVTVARNRRSRPDRTPASGSESLQSGAAVASSPSSPPPGASLSPGGGGSANTPGVNARKGAIVVSDGGIALNTGSTATAQNGRSGASVNISESCGISIFGSRLTGSVLPAASTVLSSSARASPPPRSSSTLAGQSHPNRRKHGSHSDATGVTVSRTTRSRKARKQLTDKLSESAPADGLQE